MSDDEIQLSDELEDLIRLAFEEAFEAIDEEDDLVPFAVIEQGGERFLQEYDDEGDLAIEGGRAAIKDMVPAPQRVALVYNGYVETDDEEPRDAVFVEAFESGAASAYRFFVLYTPATEDEELELDEDSPIEVLDELEPMF